VLTLAIDCAIRRINLGAAGEGNFLGELSVDVGTRQSELLPGAVHDFLYMLGLTAGDVGHIAVTAGPGYFTGIRVGLSYAAALAESVGALVSGVSTLRAMALPLIEALVACGASSVVVPVIPAGRDSFYAAMYEVCRGVACPDMTYSDGRGVLMEPSHIRAEDLFACLEAHEGSDSVIVSANISREVFEKKSLRVIPPPSVPRGVLMAAASESPVDPSEIKAVYLRRPY